MEFPFFHGKITRKACEELLSKKKKNGSYLIRESESVEGALCLCVLYVHFINVMYYVYYIFHSFENLIYTYRIFRDHQGHFRIQTSEDVPQLTFRTLKDLIYTFEKPNQGLIINLRYPVKKPKDLRRSQRCKSEMDSIYDEVDDSGDYVHVLPRRFGKLLFQDVPRRSASAAESFQLGVLCSRSGITLRFLQSSCIFYQ